MTNTRRFTRPDSGGTDVSSCATCQCIARSSELESNARHECSDCAAETAELSRLEN